MPGSNFLLFYLMATNLSTEETGSEEREGREAPHWLWGRQRLSHLLFIYFPPAQCLRKHCSPGENWVSGGRMCDVGLLASAPTSARRGQSLVTLRALGAAGFGVQGPTV